MFYTQINSPLKTMLLAATEQGLAGVYFEQHSHFKGSEGWIRQDSHPVLQLAAQQLDEYFSGQRQMFDIPLADSLGTAFQKAVWQILRSIPYGSTMSYGEIAQQLNNPGAVRAVGAANGRNPVSIIVPCHRVIASSGALTGYAGGLQNKQWLLALESHRFLL